MINRIKQLRKARGYNQTELAYMCGVSRNTITSLERGEYIAGGFLLMKLEEVFGCWVYCLDNEELSLVHDRMNDIYSSHWPD